MAIELTNRGIGKVAGMAALLPNQPIFHNCRVVGDTALKVGDIVALGTGGNKDVPAVKKAAVTDMPLGVVAYGCIKTGYATTDIVSVFPDNACVYLPAKNANITRGAKLQFDADGKVAATTTASNGYIGIALTEPVAADDLIVVQIKASK